MITQQIARIKADKARDEAHEERKKLLPPILEKVFRLIEEAANQGEYGLDLTDTMEHGMVCDQLGKLGFDCNHERYCGGSWRVRW